MGACGVQLQPLVDAMRAELLTQPVLHADETPVAMLDPGSDKTHRAYLWTYCTTGLQADRLVVFDFAESRAGRRCRTICARSSGDCPGHQPLPLFEGHLGYGAHNQRSSIWITAQLSKHVGMGELIRHAEAAAPCRTYAVLKRADEKFVTETAYDNAKFVVDITRDLAVALKGDRRIARFVVEIENFESIHNHSAVARLQYGPPQAAVAVLMDGGFDSVFEKREAE